MNDADGEVDLGITDRDILELRGTWQAQQAILIILGRMKEAAIGMMVTADDERALLQVQAYTRVIRTLEKKLVEKNKEKVGKPRIVGPHPIE